MVVAGSMIGSAIFIVASEMARQLGSPGWLLLSWLIAGVLTVTAALSYGELASMMPYAGGQYVYLREAFSPIFGFLYGWALFLIIQTGTIAAVAVGFARFLGILWPAISESNYLIAPFHLTRGYAFSLSTTQLIAVAILFLLTATNMCGLRYGKSIQNIFTVCKIAVLAAVIVIGILFGRNPVAIRANFSSMWSRHGYSAITHGISAATGYGIFVALCLSQIGSLFAADAWNNITFTAREVKDPRRNVPLSLAIGSALVIALYLLVNLAYLLTLPLREIQHAASDRVATATLQAVFPGLGVTLMAIGIMISTFGCINGMTLTGSRAYYAMARDGLFFKSVGRLNRAGVPGTALLFQGLWAGFLVLPRTYDPTTRTYGNLYSNLLSYVVSAVLVFYILTIWGIFRLRRLRPLAERPYRTVGYPVVPVAYILGAGVILIMLFRYMATTTVPGMLLIASGLPVYVVFRAFSATNVTEEPELPTIAESSEK
jgi:basic amino acid/polyamine antiporter, APA family